MHIEFEYILDQNKGQAMLSVSKGTLNEYQQNVLVSEIVKQQTRLINQFLENPGKTQHFRPESPIHGLPENVTFKYSYKSLPSAPRSVVFNMSWEDTNTASQLTQESAQEREKEGHTPPIEVSPATKAKVNEQVKQQDWATLFLEDLNKQLSSLPTLDGIEKAARDGAVAELQQLLVNHKEAALLLFSAYLHSAVTHFWPIDRDKAHSFRLAARSLEVKANTPTVPVGTETHTPTIKVQQADDSFENGGNFFIEVLRRIFPKG